MENGIADELLVLEAAKEGHVTDMAQAQQKGAVEESRDSGSTPLVSADAKGYDEISLLLHEQETQILTTAATMVPSPLPAVTSPALRKDGTAAGIAAGSDQLAREPQVEPDASEAPAVCYQSVLSQLETFLELCSKMAETQVICEDVLARLLALHYWIDEQKLRVPDESEAAFYSIVTRFNATLVQHASKSTIERIAGTRTVLGLLHDFHGAIDGVESQIGYTPFDNSQPNWKGEWDARVQAAEQRLLATWEVSARILPKELPDPESQAEVLVLLKSEIEQPQSRHSATSESLLESATKTVAGMSGATIREVPEWFIPDHAVQREARSFNVGSYGTVFHGLWQGSRVVINAWTRPRPRRSGTFCER